MGLLDSCTVYFGSNNLYSVLGVSPNASEAELKKAYKKASLLCHPDRVPEDKKEEATRKFQVLSQVHCFLTDKEKRTVYDETGSIDEDNGGLEDKDWTMYFKILFPKVTKKDIDNFMKKYKGSEDEIKDLKTCYIQHEGDMNKISESFIGYDVDDEEKFINILKELIEKNEIPDFPKFSKETKAKKNARVKRFKREAAEAETVSQEMDNSLINAITQRSANREKQFDDMIKNLESKYCKSGSTKKKGGRK